MGDFYYDILNIGQSERDLEHEISCVIKEIQDKYSISESVDGLCKVCSNVLFQKFYELGIESVILNTKELFGSYEHESVLVRGISKGKVHYYLVDMTFSQFLDNGATLRDFFSSFPADFLVKTSPEFARVLLEKGYSEVSPFELTAYFSCINQESETFLVEDMNAFFLEQKLQKF